MIYATAAMREKCESTAQNLRRSFAALTLDG